MSLINHKCITLKFDLYFRNIKNEYKFNIFSIFVAESLKIHYIDNGFVVEFVYTHELVRHHGL